MAQASQETDKKTKKRERTSRNRIPVGSRKKWEVRNQDPNFVYWGVDETREGRVQQFRDAGYEDVPSSDVGSLENDGAVGQASQQGSIFTRQSPCGSKLRLMRIPREWYEEDQKVKQERIKAKEDGLLRRKNREANQDGFYSPTGVQVENQSGLPMNNVNE